MATTAIRSHGTLLKMGSGSSAGSAIAGTQTSAVGDPRTVITSSDAHGLNDASKVTISGVTGVGATVLNTATAIPINVINTKQFDVGVVTTGVGGGTFVVTPVAESFTTIGMVGDISGPNLSRETIDVTTHDSPDDYDESITGLKNSGEVTFKINWDPKNATHDGTSGLLKKYEDGTLTNFQILNVSGDLISFAALVTGLGPAFPVNGVIQSDVTLKASGAVVITPH